MSFTLEGSFERSCRLCAEEQDVTVMIFSEEAEAMLLQNKLNQYLLIEVDEDDKLPKHICLECCSKLQIVCDFIDTARRAQEILVERSLLIDQMTAQKCLKMPNEIKSEPDDNHDDDTKITEMEISVDPMMVLQNSEEIVSPNMEDEFIVEDVTSLHAVDSEDVTIKLIRRSDLPKECNDNKDFPIKKPFPCKTCKRGFCTELALKNHSWIHVADEKFNQYKCTICQEAFDYKYNLIEHLKKHKSSGLCKICGRTFRTEKNMAVHMAAHMSAASTYPCKVCGRSYNTLSNLKAHSVTHSNERPYHCNLCKKSFKRNQDLKFHINQHTGAKPYKCPFCEKCFASSGNCYSHRNRMHPGRRIEPKTRRRTLPSRENQVLQPKTFTTRAPIATVKGLFKYQCQFCGHSFMKRDNFTYHMYQHTGEKPFQCSFCTEKFVTRRGLLFHHDKEHPSMDRPLALLSKNALLK